MDLDMLIQEVPREYLLDPKGKFGGMNIGSLISGSANVQVLRICFVSRLPGLSKLSK